MSEPTPEEISEADGGDITTEALMLADEMAETQAKRNKTFSASNAARFMSCHASANLHAAIPGYESPVINRMAGAKGRGTSMHAVLEQVTNDFNAVEMQAIADALGYVAALRMKRRFQVWTEESAVAEWLPSKPSTTVDLVLSVADELHIVDYKMGRIPVEVHDNKQLLFYAATFAFLAPKAEGVTVHIVQPLIGQMNEVWVPVDELAVFMAEAIKHDQAIIDGDLSFGPSDHCTFCPANPHSRGEKGRPLCPAMMKILYPPKWDEQAILDL